LTGFARAMVRISAIPAQLCRFGAGVRLAWAAHVSFC
jgi:hypothetical protein